MQSAVSALQIIKIKGAQASIAQSLFQQQQIDISRSKGIQDSGNKTALMKTSEDVSQIQGA